MIIKKFEAFSGAPEGGETQHQQADSDLPRSPQVTSDNIDSEDNSIVHIKDLKVDDIILFRGTKYKVVEEGEFAIKVEDVRTSKPLMINQRQLSQFGCFTIK